MGVDKKQVFISYEDHKKRQLRKEEPNRDTLTTEEQEEIARLLDAWFSPSTNTANTKISQQLDKVKLDVMTSLVHSVTLVDMLHQKMKTTQSLYAKLEEDNFNELLNTLTLICRTFAAQPQNASSVEEIYRLILISMRIMRKNREEKSTQRDIICTHLGRDRMFLNQTLWNNLYALALKKTLKKSNGVETEGSSPLKGMVYIVKGMIGEKQQQDKPSAIKQIATMMSNLNLPTEFSLPFLKKHINSEEEEPLLDFLKETLYNKQDMKLRKMLTDIKQKALARTNIQLQLISNKKTAAFALELTAKSGLLGPKDIMLRVVCKRLLDADKWIIYKYKKYPSKLFRLSRTPTKDYISMKTEVAQNTTPSTIQDIISMDVHRSLHLHATQLPPTVLHTLLRTFVYFNKSISYCQGMNYLAGYLFIKTGNEEEAYLIFEKLLLTQMRELFVNQFEALKVKMYQFTRLLNIYLPDLAQHFKRQLILPECYLVSWILTLFSSAYQYTISSAFVDSFWQSFLLEGWPAFFKWALWIHKYYKDQLCDLTFDKALHFLGAILKKPLFAANEEQLQKIVSRQAMLTQIQGMEVSQWLLDQLAKEYDLVKKPKPSASLANQS